MRPQLYGPRRRSLRPGACRAGGGPARAPIMAAAVGATLWPWLWAALLVLSDAVYEDQVGKFDWCVRVGPVREICGYFLSTYVVAKGRAVTGSRIGCITCRAQCKMKMWDPALKNEEF